MRNIDLTRWSREFRSRARAPENHIRARASRPRRLASKDPHAPTRADGRRLRNATVSLYRRPRVYTLICTRARTSATAVRLLCICLRLYGARLINTTSADDSHLYRKRHVYSRGEAHQEARKLSMPFRESPTLRHGWDFSPRFLAR